MDDLNLSVSYSFQLVLAQAVLYPSTTRNDPKTNNALQAVRKALTQPMTGTCITCHEQHFFAVPVNNDITRTSTEKWTIEADSTAQPSPEDLESAGPLVKFHGIRITTPQFRTGTMQSTTRSGQHIHQINYEATLEAVFQHLDNFFGHLAASGISGSWLYPSAQCKAVVDVRNEGIGFMDSTYARVETMKKVCARQIDGLLQGRSGFDLKAADCYSGSAEPSAIVFDQAPSTITSAQALAWIETCLSLLRYCAKVDEESFEDAISDGGELLSATLSSLRFLDTVDVLTSTYDFYEAQMRESAHIYQENLAKAMLVLGAGSGLGSLMLFRANTELKDAEPKAVLDKIGEKLKGGVYGEFGPRYVRDAIGSMRGCV